MLKVYLSGHTKETDYREYTIQKYGNKFDMFEPLRDVEAKLKLDNMENIRLGIEQLDYDNVVKLVDIEKNVIKYNINVLVAFMKVYSAGTIMEILEAYNASLPVYVIDPTKRFRNDIWIRYHTNTFFNTIDNCFDWLMQTYY